MSLPFLSIRGAREHNLKGIDLDIPRDRFVVITGVSGSGKSSLAFDTIYAEGQRRYVESLSAYARQFLGQMEKPDVDLIEGLSPAISIEQRTAGRNPRSTVATVTEIYDYLRLLFSRIGVRHCPKCGRRITRQSIEEMVQAALALGEGRKISILAPIVRGRKGEYAKELSEARRSGFLRARIDGKVVEIEEGVRLPKTKKHTIEIVVDRVTVAAKGRKRIADSLETALRLAKGLAAVLPEDGEEILLSELSSCVNCGLSFEEPAPRMFSFNSPYGACPTCDGLGTHMEIDPDLLVPDPSLSIVEGAVESWRGREDGWFQSQTKALAKKFGFDPKTPWKRLPAAAKKAFLFGTGKDEIEIHYSSAKADVKFRSRFEGIVPNLMRRYRETQSEMIREWISQYMAERPCQACGGSRLKPESLAVKVAGRNIHEVVVRPVDGALEWIGALELSARDRVIAEPIQKEIRQRLEFLADVGLAYLTLDRSAGTLSGGEAQRIRLATQIGSRLMGVLYILDEPSIGLHHRDNRKLLDTLLRLRDLGNTVIVVEHDRETIEAADHVVDLGPGAGRLGGRVVASGTPREIEETPGSITGRYLSGQEEIPVPRERRKGTGKAIVVEGARENNLKEIDVAFPLGVFTCVTGVSGSGKSTLVNDILYRALSRHFYGAHDAPGAHRRVRGLEHIDKVVDIDQSPIGRTPRSNPATYTGAFTHVRDLFSTLPEAKVRGYRPGRFSFNVKGGRCESCQGDGVVKIEMHFLPDVYVRCDICGGKRYNRETLEVTYKGKNIAEVLEMTVEEAVSFFAHQPQLHRKLEVLERVGLGYIHLGQAATTLSGGEAQRIKLSTELSKIATGNTVYLLDEPTTGLHFADVKLLLGVLGALVERGNTVIVIEHNLDVIKTADHIVDLGPGGGEAGGRVVASGTPEDVLRVRGSYTGEALRETLRANARPPRGARNGRAAATAARGESRT